MPRRSSCSPRRSASACTGLPGDPQAEVAEPEAQQRGVVESFPAIRHGPQCTADAAAGTRPAATRSGPVRGSRSRAPQRFRRRAVTRIGSVIEFRTIHSVSAVLIDWVDGVGLDRACATREEKPMHRAVLAAIVSTGAVLTGLRTEFRIRKSRSDRARSHCLRRRSMR